WCSARMARCAGAKSRLLSKRSGTPVISATASLIAFWRSGLATSNSRRRTTSSDPASNCLSCPSERSPRWPTASVSTPSWLARSPPDQHARCIDHQGQPLGELGARDQLGMRHEVDQDFVEEIDVIGPQTRGVLEEQVGDAAGSLGPPFRIAISDDLIESGDQR